MYCHQAGTAAFCKKTVTAEGTGVIAKARSSRKKAQQDAAHPS